MVGVEECEIVKVLYVELFYAHTRARSHTHAHTPTRTVLPVIKGSLSDFSFREKARKKPRLVVLGNAVSNTMCFLYGCCCIKYSCGREGPWGPMIGHKGTRGAEWIDKVAAGDFPPAAGRRGINDQVSDKWWSSRPKDFGFGNSWRV